MYLFLMTKHYFVNYFVFLLILIMLIYYIYLLV